MTISIQIAFESLDHMARDLRRLVNTDWEAFFSEAESAKPEPVKQTGDDAQWGRVAEVMKEATPDDNKSRRGRKSKTETAPPEPPKMTVAEIKETVESRPMLAVSTGEERVDPTEDDIQDMADEQAETDAARVADTPLTIDDVRKMAMGYYEKFGKEAAIEDGGSILADALGAPPNGEKIWKMSIIPDDQIILRKAMLALQTATAGAERYKSAGA